jgi:hypothetical protein
MKSLFGALATAAALALTAGAAKADVHWTVNGTFDDGGTLSGFFDINVYGYLQDFDLVTSAGGAEGGFEYTPATSYFSNGTFYLDAEPGYFGALHLTFLSDIGAAIATNPLLGGSPGPSWECVQSWSCYVPQGGTTRYIAEGFASAGSAAPEPAAWGLMIAGFGLAGAALRKRRTIAAAR